MSTEVNVRRASKVGFVIGAIALVVAGGAFWSIAQSEADPAPAADVGSTGGGEGSGDFESGGLEAVDIVDRSGLPDCRRRMVGTEIVPRGKLAEELDAGALSFRAIRPASTGTQGGSQLFIKSTFRFSCDGSTGVIGYRGGFRLERDGRFVDFRRLRIDADRNLIKMFADSVTQQGYDGLTCDLDLATSREVDGRVITTIPLLLTGEGTVAMNVGLGFSNRFREGDVVGDIVMEMENIT